MPQTDETIYYQLYFQVPGGCYVTYDPPGYAKFRNRSHDAVIRVYDAAGNVIETHEQLGNFKER